MGKRGPPPKSLIKLYHLKKAHPSASDSELAEALGVKPSTLTSYEWRLKNLPYTIASFCPECFRRGVFRDPETGEVVCRNCGLVVHNMFSPLQRVPMNTTAAPTSFLAVGKSLGSEVGSNRKHLFQVLAKAPEGKKDIGLRARFIRIISNSQEPPYIQSLLKRGYNLSKKLGLDGDIMFNQSFGVNLRRAAALINDLHLKISKRKVVETALYLTLCQSGEHVAAQRLRKSNKLRVDPQLLSVLLRLNHFLKKLKKTPPISPKVIEIFLKTRG